MFDIQCPYCDGEFEICNDDGFGLEEDIRYEQECPHCEKLFVFTTWISFDYSPKRADCLNGEPHAVRPLRTFPIERTKMYCRDCNYSRNPTDKEMADILKAASTNQLQG